MPSKKKKYNARFPAGRIKKIMQSDEEIGKVAQAVPVIISRTLELFVESLLTKTLKITNTRNAKTLSPTHLKQCIMAEQRFDFLRELVKNLPDISLADEAAANYDDVESSPEQDSFSDPSMDTHQQQQATTSITHTNGQMDESKLRRTRSIQQQFEQQQQQQHEILERIQKSMHHHKLLRTESTPNAETTCSAPKRARQTAAAATTTTATTFAGKCKQTEPIVHVQFDYGNIDWKLKNDKSVPLSAPAQIVQPVFDFSQLGSNQTPISISIDLSSINKNNSTPTATATATTTSAITSQAAKPKATITTTTSPPPPPRTLSLEKSNTLLELDEDYDDI